MPLRSTSGSKRGTTKPAPVFWARWESRSKGGEDALTAGFFVTTLHASSLRTSSLYLRRHCSLGLGPSRAPLSLHHLPPRLVHWTPPPSPSSLYLALALNRSAWLMLSILSPPLPSALNSLPGAKKDPQGPDLSRTVPQRALEGSLGSIFSAPGAP